MIKRHYFASYVKYHDDGKGSFSFKTFTFSRKSFLPNHQDAYEEAMDFAKKELSHAPGNDSLVNCIAFNRI